MSLVETYYVLAKIAIKAQCIHTILRMERPVWSRLEGREYLGVQISIRDS